MRAHLSLVGFAVVLVLAGCTPKIEEEPKESGKDGGNTNTGDGGKMPGNDSGLDPTMGAKVTVSGLVLDVVGNHVEGAELKLGQHTAKSGANGDFSFGTV